MAAATAQPQPLPQLFGLIPTGHPPIIAPTSAPTQTSLLYAIPAGLTYSHLVVFLLPGISLPPNTAAAVYLQLPPSSAPSAPPEFKFLGGVGPGKESAVFRIRGPASASAEGVGGGAAAVIGISIEDASAVTEKMAALPASQEKAAGAPDTLVLAQRIIKNAFNFLAGFSGNTAGGVEVVPLKAFEEWWRKFEARVRADPGFLERDAD
jgi:protein Hikeshi